MGLPIKRQQEDMFNGIMFFIPLSDFIVTKLEIIGNKLDLTYTDSLNSQIRVKIYYENKFLNSINSIDESIKRNYQLEYPPTYLNLMIYNNDNIVDKLVFDFDPRQSPEKGRITFVLTREYIESLIQSGENTTIEFKGLQNLNWTTAQKDDLTETFVSFANIDGGIIILGVSDDKKIIGFKQAISAAEIYKQLVDLVYNWCDPTIDFIVNEIDMHDGDRLVLIHVNKGNNPPYMKVAGRTGTYLRIN